MKRSRFSGEQIIYAIRQAESDRPVGDLCRQLGVSEATFYAGKRKYAHLGRERAAPTSAVGGRQQPVETARRRPLARHAQAGGGPAKNSRRPARRRELAACFHGTFQVSGLWACRLAPFSRAAWYRRRQAMEQTALRIRIRDLAYG